MKTSSKLIKKLQIAGRYFLYILSILATIYIFAAAYELIFNKNLPIVQTVDVVDISSFKSYINPASSMTMKSGNYGNPEELKIQSTKSRIVIAPGTYDSSNKQWLARISTGHIILLSNSKDGQLGDALIYARSSWRTIPNPETLVIGDNIYLDTDREWRYFYRITDVKTKKLGDAYIAQDSGTSQLYLDFSDNLYGMGNIIVAANLVSVQNVSR